MNRTCYNCKHGFRYQWENIWTAKCEAPLTNSKDAEKCLIFEPRIEDEKQPAHNCG